MSKFLRFVSVVVAALVIGVFGVIGAAAAPPATTVYNSHHPSHFVECQVVDQAIARIPHGDGDGVVTTDEAGPGGWRFNGGGRSFVTFGHSLNGAGDGYIVDAGRSNVGANSGIINDYPAVLDLPQTPVDDVLVFSGNHGVLTLSGGDEFQLPGADNGEVRINLQRTTNDDGNAVFEGCAKTPQITNFGFTVQEGGDFVQQEYFKAYAEADEDGVVTYYEWTEISTFKNTNPNVN